MDKETNIGIDNKSCRNCLLRFTCDSRKDGRFDRCDRHMFDEEAATCEDCSKKYSCEGYKPNSVICGEWDPEETCDCCSKQDTCPNYVENGRICDKYIAAEFRLTEKGLFYLVLLNNGLGPGLVEETDFFEVLDHEIKINGLFDVYRHTRIGRLFESFKRIFKKKPKKTVKDIFFETAHITEYYGYFMNDDENVALVWNEFNEGLKRLYSVSQDMDKEKIGAMIVDDIIGRYKASKDFEKDAINFVKKEITNEINAIGAKEYLDFMERGRLNFSDSVENTKTMRAWLDKLFDMAFGNDGPKYRP